MVSSCSHFKNQSGFFSGWSYFPPQWYVISLETKTSWCWSCIDKTFAKIVKPLCKLLCQPTYGSWEVGSSKFFFIVPDREFIPDFLNIFLWQPEVKCRQCRALNPQSFALWRSKHRGFKQWHWRHFTSERHKNLFKKNLEWIPSCRMKFIRQRAKRVASLEKSFG